VSAVISAICLAMEVAAVRRVVVRNEGDSVAALIVAATIFVTALGGLGLLFVLVAVSTYRERVTAAGSSLHQSSLGRPKVVLLPEVTRAEWRHRGACVVLHSPTGRMLISFAGLKDGLALRDWVVGRLPAGVHEGEGPPDWKRARPAKPPVVIDGPKLLALSLANAIVAAVACGPWDPPRVAFGVVFLACLVCPAVVVLAVVDAVLRPSRSTVAAALIGLAATAALAVKGWGLYQAMIRGLL
jgi:hypothetical protein